MTEIQIPYQDRAQTLADAIACNVDRALDGEERDIAFQVLFDSPPSQTMGELFDRLDADGRDIVNKARSELGLESVEEVEAHQAFEAANRNLPPSRDAEGRIFQSCHAANCQVFPLGEHGEPVSVPDRRWWCDQHGDQAGPEDHLPPEPEYVLDMRTMSLKAVGAERERLLEEDRQLVEKARERQERQRQEAEALDSVQQRYGKQGKTMNIAGFQVRPDGVVVGGE